MKFISRLILSLMILLATQQSYADDKPLTVFAAASLTDILPKLATEWAEAKGQPVPRLSFAASAIMARQVVAGAPADIFISANPTWIKHVKQHIPNSTTVYPVAKNRLVLAVPNSLQLTQGQLSTSDILTLLSASRFAIADPAIAPAGQYAKNYLTQLGIWDGVSSQAAYGSNVRQTLLLIERGGVPGFVYNSDAVNSSLVKIVHTAPENLSGAIHYRAVNITEMTAPIDSFLSYLASPVSKTVWKLAGFH